MLLKTLEPGAYLETIFPTLYKFFKFGSYFTEVAGLWRYLTK